MKIETLKASWIEEENHAFSGWDFSHLQGRMSEEPLPWDYRAIVLSYMSADKTLLDMGTGGAEVLLSLDPAPGKTWATECYRPNYELCRKILPERGIEVVFAEEEDKLPFEDGFFDLVINRHESFYPQEIKRILRPGGVFITQQVGGKNNRELAEAVMGKAQDTYISNNLTEVRGRFESCGFEILRGEEFFSEVRFSDVGAVVFYAKVIGWEFPDFSATRCFDRLLALQEKLESQGWIESTEHRFLLAAKKL